MPDKLTFGHHNLTLCISGATPSLVLVVGTALLTTYGCGLAIAATTGSCFGY